MLFLLRRIDNIYDKKGIIMKRLLRLVLSIAILGMVGSIYAAKSVYVKLKNISPDRILLTITDGAGKKHNYDLAGTSSDDPDEREMMNQLTCATFGSTCVKKIEGTIISPIGEYQGAIVDKKVIEALNKGVRGTTNLGEISLQIGHEYRNIFTR